MENNGTMPAFFDFEDVFSQYSNNIINKYDNQNNLLETIDTLENGNSPIIGLLIGGMVGQTVNDQYYISNTDEFVENFGYVNEETGEIKIILKPGESLYIPLLAIWDDLVYNENNVKYEATGTFKINWIQYTD